MLNFSNSIGDWGGVFSLFQIGKGKNGETKGERVNPSHNFVDVVVVASVVHT
jgi:hypothetical protein